MVEINYARGLNGDAELIETEEGEVIEVFLDAEVTNNTVSQQVLGFLVDDLPEQEILQGADSTDLETEYRDLVINYGKDMRTLIGSEPAYEEERELGELVERHNDYSATLKQ